MRTESKHNNNAGGRDGQIVGVFIDFYGTLVGGDREAIEAVCANVIHDCNMNISPSDLGDHWGYVFFDEIEHASSPTFRNLFACECSSLIRTLGRYDLRIDPAPYAEQLRKYWREPQLFPGVSETLSALSVPVCVVSNADHGDLLAAIASLGLDFQYVVSSEITRSYKPDPQIFRHALGLTGWPAERVMHVGDSLHSDVGGALSVGLQTVWLDRPGRISDIGEARPDHRISNLPQLLGLLDEGR